MKRKQVIRWRETASNRQYKEGIGDILRGALYDSLLLTGCTLLFFVAAYLMLQDVFGWGEFGEGSVFRILVLSLLVGTLMELRFAFGKVVRRSLPLGVLLVGVLCFVLYLRFTEGGTEVLSGLTAMGAEYARDWNTYFGTGLYLPYGDAEYIDKAMEFSMLFLSFLCTWGAKLLRETLVPLLVPAFVLAAILLVGFAPEGWGLLWMFAAVLLSNTGEFALSQFCSTPGSGRTEEKSARLFRWLPVVAILLLCIVTKAAGNDAAERAVAGRYEEMKQWQSDVIDAVSGWDFWNELDVSEALEDWAENLFDGPDATKAEISNDNPDLDETKVLKLWLSEKPQGNVYLKGFYADIYEEGEWSSDNRNFVKACEQAGFDSSLVKQELAVLGVENLLSGVEVTSLAEDEEGVEAKLSYFSPRGKNAYLPYFSEVLEKDVSVEGDSRFVKKSGTKELSFSIWKYDGAYVSHLISFWGGKERDWEAWYETYVEEQYLSVPSYVPTAKRIARELTQSGKESGVLKDTGFINESSRVNENRLNKAYLVAEWLRTNTEYSWELEALPAGTDATEYFLKTGRVGYCMHYASAATLMLRSMGVPARYVSGYIAKQATFEPTIDGYEATVLENSAHAWVEIYLSGIGWVPVEVTKGYSAQLSGGSVIVRYPSTSSVMEFTPVATPTPVPTEAPKGEKKPTVTPASTRKPTAGPTPVGGSGTSQTGGAKGPNSTDGSRSSGKSFYVEAVAIMFVLPFLMFIKFAVVPLIRKIKTVKMNRESRRLRKKLNRLGNRRAISLLNQKLYRKLRRTGKILKAGLSDAEYEEVLQKHGKEVLRVDWKRYMKLVKEAAFSYNEFSKEDVEFCYEIYQKVYYNLRREEESGRE